MEDAVHAVKLVPFLPGAQAEKPFRGLAERAARCALKSASSFLYKPFPFFTVWVCIQAQAKTFF